MNHHSLQSPSPNRSLSPSHDWPSPSSSTSPLPSLTTSPHLLSDKSCSSTNLTTSERHRQIRLEADKHYRNNAEKMKLQYSKRRRHQIKIYEPGDTVTVRIPRNERSSSDMPRLLCCVLKVNTSGGNHIYRLQ